MKVEWINLNWDDVNTIPNQTDEIRLAYKFKDMDIVNEDGTLFYIGNKEFRYSEGYLSDLTISEGLVIWWCYAPIFEG